MEFAMYNTEGDIAKEYVEYEVHKEHNEEFNTDRSIVKGHINSYEEVRAPRLWICGGHSQNEFQSFKHQWSLFRGYHRGMDDGELRYQLLDSISGPLEDAMYEAFGNRTYAIPEGDPQERELPHQDLREEHSQTTTCTRKYSSQQPSSQ
jgi:hypothetical protein